MIILDDIQIQRKIKRIAIQIHEQNFDKSGVVLLGINNNGYRFAQLLGDELRYYDNKKYTISRIKLNPAQPVSNDILSEYDISKLKLQQVIIVDDVANTGRTIFYAFKPLMDVLINNLEVAVLLDRKHKRFPIDVKYVGLSLFTTFKETIKVNLSIKNKFNATLI